MATVIRPLITAKTAENAQTTQYTASGVTAIIDKFTATNYSALAATLSVNLVAPGGTPSDSNLIVKAKILQPSETYTFPELVGHAVSSGGYISTLASAATSITIRASGREVS